jgi:hypothetical protein
MMQREVGNPEFPIWLIGDSNPKQWQDKLTIPLDPRHPIRHNIWTSILDVIQDQVFRFAGKRLDTSQFFIRNAVDNPDKKPEGSSIDWSRDAIFEQQQLTQFIERYQPKILFSFGAFAFEFTRRAVGEQGQRKFSYWGARQLGDEFRKRINGFDTLKGNILPLLHRSISGGKFIQSHDQFSGGEGVNYFDYTGGEIARVLIDKFDGLPIWILRM